MRRGIKILIVGLMTIAFSMNGMKVNATGNDSAGVVDTNLKIELNKILNKPDVNSDITIDEMKSISGSIRLKEKGISNLSGLEYLSNNVTFLELNSNSISDITPISNLRLNTLLLESNNISDASPLANLQIGNNGIKRIEIGKNPLSNIDFVSGLSSLEILNIGGCEAVSNLSAVSGLTNLKKLLVHQTGVSDLSYIAGITSLEDVTVYATKIKDLSPLSSLININTLKVSWNDLSNADLSVLRNLPLLVNLEIADTNIDYNDLAGLTTIKTLDLSYGNLNNADIGFISTLTGLEKLTLNFSKITDISSLSPILANLTKFDVKNQEIIMPEVAVLRNGSYNLTNVITDVNGNIVAPSSIPNGTYDAVSKVVTWDNISNVSELTYDFSQTFGSGFTYSGKVIQPVIIEDTLTITGIPTSLTMTVGDKLTLSPSVSNAQLSDGWSYDTSYFDASFVNAIIFKAKKAGTTIISYTTRSGQQQLIALTIKDKEITSNPSTSTPSEIDSSKFSKDINSIRTGDIRDMNKLIGISLLSITAVLGIQMKRNLKGNKK